MELSPAVGMHWIARDYRAFLGKVPPWLRRIAKRPINLLLAALTVIWLVYTASEILGQQHLYKCDWMLISSGPAFIPTIYFASRIRPEFYRVFRYLLRTTGMSGLTIVTSETRREYEAYARVLERRGAIFIAAAEFGTIAYVFFVAPWLEDGAEALLWEDIRFALPLLVLCTVCGWVAGARFGRLQANASLLRFLDRYGWHVRLVPGHPDGSGGLRRFGQFLIFQFNFTMVPLVWLAAWTILCPDWDHPDQFLQRLKGIYGWDLTLPHWIADHCHPANGVQTCAFTGYDRYGIPFAVLWAIALGYLIAGVMLPLHRVHRLMVKSKREVSDLVRPELSRRAFDGRQRIAAARTPDQMLDALDSYARNAKAADDVKKLSVWPLDVRTVAIFSATKAVTYGLPLALYMASRSHKVDGQMAQVLVTPLKILQYVVRLIF